MSDQVLVPATTRFVRTVQNAWRYPNPLWLRELRQASRIKRTPFILMSVTIVAALAMGGVSGMESEETAPAEVGAMLYQVFFSMAFFVIALVGPAVGANNIASEREGRTWEPLILTGVPTPAMARGKFLSALTAVLQYLAILAPVGALPFLFGGVSATEVIVAFLCLIMLCILSVGFGLAIGSSISKGRIAIVVAIICAASLAVGAYSFIGITLSKQIHYLWSVVPSGQPVWLPTALASVPFSARYLVFLVIQPLTGIVVAAWFFREVTIANMTSAFKDQSSGLLRWLAASTCLLGAALVASLFVDGANWLDAAAMRALFGMAVFFVLTTLALQGSPICSRNRGPNVMQAMARLLGYGLVCLVMLTVISLIVIDRRVTDPFVDGYLRLIGIAGVYFGAFLVFVVGMGTWLRHRMASVAAARVALVVALLLAISGPFVLAALTGVLADEAEANLAFAAPSPAYVLVLVKNKASLAASEVLVRSALCSAAWVVAGVVFFLAARRTSAFKAQLR